jgi:DNA invertase Pin-like site-specific DNA recombinase
MDTLNIGYFRVSKEEENGQDIDSQILKVKEFFNVDYDFLLKERGSAYDLNKIHKRTEFLRLISLMFRNTSLEDVFTGNFKRKEINLYIYSYDRLMRNIRLNTLLMVLCDLFDVKIYSFRENKEIPLKKEEETPSETLGRYLHIAIKSYSSEEYSNAISSHIKKVVVKKKDGTSRSAKDNKKWGRQFTDIEGNNVSITEKEENGLRKRIIYLIIKFERMNFKNYYNDIIEDISRNRGISITKAYISKLKKGLIRK